MYRTKENLKAIYKKLPRVDKERLGAALVKVNMGVALPHDLRLVAQFLKGSRFIAKPESLDEIIQYIHDEQDGSKNQKIAGGTQTVSEKEVLMNQSVIQKLQEYDEDSEVTVKDKTEKGKKV